MSDAGASKAEATSSSRGDDPEGAYHPNSTTPYDSPVGLKKQRSKSLVIPPTIPPSTSPEANTSARSMVNPGGATLSDNHDWDCFLEQSIAVYTGDAPEIVQQNYATAQQEAADRALAQKLQDEPSTMLVRLPEPEVTTATGKALQFTQLLIETFQENSDAKGQLMNLVHADIIVACAEKMFDRQEKQPAGHHRDVDIAFASTDDHGQIVKAPSPASFGDGVYTSNNPFSPIFQEFPTEIILMARLKGNMEIASAKTGIETQYGHQNVDSSALKSMTDDEICVLKRSSQCVPLLTINAGELDFDHDDAPGNDFVHRMHCLLQGVVDETWNKGRPPTIVTRVLPSETKPKIQDFADGDPIPEVDEEPWLGIEPKSAPAIPRTRTWTLHSLIYYVAPETIDHDEFCITSEERLRNIMPFADQSGKCLICNQKGSNTLFSDCRHPFHVGCLFRRLKRGGTRRCPKCSIESSNRYLLWETANIASAAKEPALVLVARLDLTNNDSQRMKQSSKKGNHCSSSEAAVTLVAAASPEGVIDLKRLFLVYICGSTFDIKLSRDPGSDGRIATWSAMFHDQKFVRYLHERTRKHIQSCNACRRRRRSPPSIIVGTMPTGTMRVDEIPDVTCSGHSPGTLLVTYRIEEGIQKDYHEDPGASFDSMYREAFLPNDRQGRDLLKRLTFAFYRGLTFVVRSKTRASGESKGIIQWGAIPHKSSLSPGTNGYPDPSYFVTANQSLDSLGVPKADAL